MTSPAPEVLRSVLRYYPKSGRFFWKKREGVWSGWNARVAGKEAFTTTSVRGYKTTNFTEQTGGKAKLLTAHRTAWAIFHGEWPSGQIDHINGNKTDNKISNLRDVVSAENARNTAIHSNNSSGVSGVYLHRQTGKWCAQIHAFGKAVGLGLFTQKSDAIIARKAAERVLGYHENHGRPSK